MREFAGRFDFAAVEVVERLLVHRDIAADVVAAADDDNEHGRLLLLRLRHANADEDDDNRWAAVLAGGCSYRYRRYLDQLGGWGYDYAMATFPKYGCP